MQKLMIRRRPIGGSKNFRYGVGRFFTGAHVWRELQSQVCPTRRPNSAPKDHAKILAAIHARDPMVPPDELHAFQRGSLATEAKFWETLAELNDDLKRGLR